MTEQQKALYKAISDAYMSSDPQIIISCIAKHLSPDEVFPKRELLTYLEDYKASLENKLPANY